jgi:dUTP pyrophosphatase
MAKQTKEGVQFVIMDDRVKEPSYATAASAGIDLQAMNFDGLRMQGRSSIPPGGRFVIGTGLAVHIGSLSDELVGMVYPRSSLGKRGLALQNTIGLIDADYQGEILLMGMNTGRHMLFIDPTERIAQMILVPVFRTELVRVKEFTPTARGTGGIGSTGK